jgi:hypothetical protein
VGNEREALPIPQKRKIHPDALHLAYIKYRKAITLKSFQYIMYEKYYFRVALSWSALNFTN